MVAESLGGGAVLTDDEQSAYGYVDVGEHLYRVRRGTLATQRQGSLRPGAIWPATVLDGIATACPYGWVRSGEQVGLTGRMGPSSGAPPALGVPLSCCGDLPSAEGHSALRSSCDCTQTSVCAERRRGR